MEHDDLIAEILECMGDVEPPSPETGWVTVKILKASAKTLSDDQIRAKLDGWVDVDHTWERVKANGKNWYRRLSSEQIQG